ncbi:MAG: XrtA/PEP-CTERM system exopolysaccharide export protein [Gammaproteobacteria bacterium]
MRKVALSLTLIALCGLLAACGSTPPTAQERNATVAPTAATDGEYSIGAGDSLDIYVWRHDDLSRTVPVRPDGKVSTPLVEDMQAAGKTPTQLARDIELVLGEYIKSPKVTVILAGFQGASSDQIRVIGEASQPQSIPYRQGLTLLDVMISVGGLTDVASGKRTKILRRKGAGMEELKVRPDILLRDGDIRYNVNMLPGDVLIIPEARF